MNYQDRQGKYPGALYDGGNRTPNGLHFRSLVTAAMPPVSIPWTNRLTRITPRVIIFASVSFLILFFIAAIHQEWLPKHGLGILFYWLHDYVFLRIKAYSFVLYCPKSLIWWSLIFIVAGAILVSWLLDLSLIKKPHTFLLRLILQQPMFYPFLIQCAKIFNKVRVRPRFLFVTAITEWEQALINLTMHKQGHAPGMSCRRIAGLMQLQLSLTLVIKNDSVQKLQALERWSRSLLYLYVWGSADRKWFKNIITDLVEASGLNEPATVSWDNTQVKIGEFTIESILADLNHLTRIGPDDWLGGNAFVDSLACLVESCEKRRRYLYDCCRRLEKIRSHGDAQSDLGDLAPIVLSPEKLPVAGQLVANITLQTALLVDEPRMATAFLEVIENIYLLANVAPQQGAENLRALVLSIPTNQYFRIHNEQMWDRHKQEIEEWKLEMQLKDGALRIEDVILLYDHFASLMLASGPDAKYVQKKTTYER